VLKQAPEHDTGSAILYFQLGEGRAAQQGGAPGREGEDATAAETREHASMGQSRHPTFPMAGTGEEEEGSEALRYKASPALKLEIKQATWCLKTAN